MTTATYGRPGGPGGGASAYGLGPPQNTFADDTARDAYATANPTWLAQYNDNRFFWIRSGTQIQRRNAASNGWEQVTAVVQGPAGRDGLPADVETDATLSGDGSSGDPLAVANPFTDDDESHLDALPALWAAGVHAVDDQVSWAAKVYRCIVARQATDTDNPADDTTGWAELGTGGGTTFTPSQQNLYEAVKAIFHPATNPAVEADDQNNELDISGGGALSARGREIVQLNQQTANLGTATTNLTAVWQAAAAGVFNSFDEILVHVDIGTSEYLLLMPHARIMETGTTYYLLATEGTVITQGRISPQPGQTRTINIALQAAATHNNTTITLYGVNYVGARGTAGANGYNIQPVYVRHDSPTTPPTQVPDPAADTVAGGVITAAPSPWVLSLPSPTAAHPYIWASFARVRGTEATYSAPFPLTGAPGQSNTDATLTGDGSTESPLSVANPFTDDDEAQLDALPALWAAGTHAVGDQVSWAGKVYRCLLAREATNTNNPATDTEGWAELGTGTVADSVELSVSGQDLTVTVGRTAGADLTDTVTLPGSGAGTVFAPVLLTNEEVADPGTQVFNVVDADGNNVVCPASGFLIIAVHTMGDFEGNATWRLAADLRAATATDPLHIAATGGAVQAVLDLYTNDDNEILGKFVDEPGGAIDVDIWHVQVADPEAPPTPTGYSFFAKYDAMSTPSFGPIVTPAFNADPGSTGTNDRYSVAANADYEQQLFTTTVVGLTPGYPTTIDYEGLIQFRAVGENRDRRFWRIEFGYRLFPGVAAKQATFWRHWAGEIAQGVETPIGADTFSSIGIFDVGTVLPLDSDPTQNTYVMTQADFDGGLPVEVVVRLRAYDRNNTGNRAAGAFNLLSSDQLAMVAFQIPAPRVAPTGHKRYVGWSAAAQPTLTEFNAGEEFDGDVLTIPAASQDGFLWFAIPADVDSPTAAYFDGNTRSVLQAFDQRTNIETDPDGTANSGDEVDHKVWSTFASQRADVLGTGSRTLTLEYS